MGEFHIAVLNADLRFDASVLKSVTVPLPPYIQLLDVSVQNVADTVYPVGAYELTS